MLSVLMAVRVLLCVALKVKVRSGVQDELCDSVHVRVTDAEQVNRRVGVRVWVGVPVGDAVAIPL